MKKILTLLLSILVCSTVFAQYYYLPNYSPQSNPGGLNTDNEYPVAGGLDASWTSIDTGSVTSPRWSPVQTIPFTFNFNGAAVTQYKVSTSGVLTFDVAAPTAPPSTPGNIPDASIPDNSVLVWGLDAPGDNDEIVIKTFGAPGSQQHWIFFSSYNYDGGGTNCWTYWSIVLEEGSDKIYIVDQRNTTTAGCVPALTLGIQIDQATAIEVTNSPAIAPLAGSNFEPVDNVYYEFIYGTQPDPNLAGIEVLMFDIVDLTQAPFNFDVVLENQGTQTVSSLDLNYAVDGGAPVTGAVSGLTFDPFTADTLPHPMGWTPPAAGNYTLKVWASNINGSADMLPANDTITFTIQVAPSSVSRVLLHEIFTSSTSTASPNANTALKTLQDANAGKFAAVRYPMTWPTPGDPYNTAAASDRQAYYSITFVPRIVVDGRPDFSHLEYTQDMLNAWQSEPAFMQIDATATNVCGQISVSADITSLADFTGASLVAHIAVVERTTFNNEAGNGETAFYDVMHAMLPTSAGTTLGGMATGATTNISQNYTVPAVTNIEQEHDLVFVVFVQDNNSRKVLNSAYAVNQNGDDLTVEDVTTSALLSMDNAPFSITGRVRNLSQVPVTSYDISYSVDGGSDVTTTISGVNIPWDGTHIFTHDVPWNPDTAGSYQITLNVQGVNGGTDVGTCNDQVAKFLNVQAPSPNGIGLPGMGGSPVELFPNPATDQVTMHYGVANGGDVSIKVFNILGERMHSILLPNQANGVYQRNLDVSQWEAGLYLVEVEVNGVAMVKKLSVHR